LRPDEALECFLRTRMDVLVMGQHVLERPRAASTNDSTTDRLLGQVMHL
jgi:hypothetical protein